MPSYHGAAMEARKVGDDHNGPDTTFTHQNMTPKSFQKRRLETRWHGNQQTCFSFQALSFKAFWVNHWFESSMFLVLSEGLGYADTQQISKEHWKLKMWKDYQQYTWIFGHKLIGLRISRKNQIRFNPNGHISTFPMI